MYPVMLTFLTSCLGYLNSRQWSRDLEEFTSNPVLFETLFVSTTCKSLKIKAFQLLPFRRCFFLSTYSHFKQTKNRLQNTLRKFKPVRRFVLGAYKALEKRMWCRLYLSWTKIYKQTTRLSNDAMKNNNKRKVLLNPASVWHSFWVILFVKNY